MSKMIPRKKEIQGLLKSGGEWTIPQKISHAWGEIASFFSSGTAEKKKGASIPVQADPCRETVLNKESRNAFPYKIS